MWKIIEHSYYLAIWLFSELNQRSSEPRSMKSLEPLEKHFFNPKHLILNWVHKSQCYPWEAERGNREERVFVRFWKENSSVLEYDLVISLTQRCIKRFKGTNLKRLGCRIYPLLWYGPGFLIRYERGNQYEGVSCIWTVYHIQKRYFSMEN